MKSRVKSLLILLVALPLLVFAVKSYMDFRRQAAGNPANIFIDTTSLQGAVPSSLWRNLSQGGEEPLDMIKPVIPQVKALDPQVIRIDHIFDFYGVDKGGGSYDFSRLDSAVNSILATGAVPMLSLSYTTNDMSVTGQNAGQPKDWNQWYQLVRATAHHYSVEKGISGIYYEVWNEPDLFGGWHYNKDPNYSTLYIQSARGVADGAGAANYKMGGPAITAYYGNWIKSLFATATNNHLRLDFISWHKYSKNLDDYDNDFNDLNTILSDYPQYFNIERLITEVGPDPEPSAWYDNSLSGVHLIALSTRLAGKIHRLFVFEPVDGPNPRSSISTGWGLMTHTGTAKPRYYAIQFLNRLGGQRLATVGDGSWVTSLSTKNGTTIQTLVANYDRFGVHAETFPITYQHLAPGNYQQKITYYLGRTSTQTLNINGAYRFPFYLEANSAALIELTPIQ